VVGVEHVLRGLQVLAHLAALLPRHAQQPVQVVAHNPGLGRHRRHLLELVELVAGLGLDRLRHAGGGDPAGDLVEVVRGVVQLAQLLLDRLHLLVEVVLALRLLHLRLDPAADALLHLLHVDLAVDQANQHLQPLGGVQGLQQLLLVAEADADMGGDGVGQARRVVDPGQGLQQLRRQLAVGLDVLLEQPHQRARDGVQLARLAAVGGFHHHPGAGQGAIHLADRVDVGAGQALDQHLDGAVRQLQQLQHLRQRADRMQVGGTRVVGFRRLLRDQQDPLVALHREVERADRLVAADKQRDHHVREHHDVAQRQHRQDEAFLPCAGMFGAGAHADSCCPGRAGCAATATVMGLSAAGCKQPRRPAAERCVPSMQKAAMRRPSAATRATGLSRPTPPSAAGRPRRRRTRCSCRSGRARTCARSPIRRPPPC